MGFKLLKVKGYFLGLLKRKIYVYTFISENIFRARQAKTFSAREFDLYLQNMKQ